MNPPLPAPALIPAGTRRPVSPWWVLAVVLAAEVMDLLDTTVVNVAGPAIRASLGSSPTALQWVIGGYALTLGAGLVLGGRLGDRFGRRRTFLIGLAAFTIASLACALAPGTGVLIAFRLAQGAAAALLLPQGFGLIRATFPPERLGSAFAFFGPVIGLAGIAGPVVGGALVQANLAGTSWRLVFLVNVPLGLAALALGRRLLPHPPVRAGITIDVPGAILMATSCGLLVAPLIEGQDLGWPWWIWSGFVLAAAGFGLFVRRQRVVTHDGLTPLVTATMFAHRGYTVGLVGVLLFFTATTGAQLGLSLFLQLGHGYTAGAAGLANIPLALGSAIGGAVVGALLTRRLGRGILQLGGALSLGGVVLLVTALASGPFDYPRLVPGLVLTGIGSGLLVSTLMKVVIAAVADHEIGSGSGVLAATQSVAGSLGVAVAGLVYFSQTSAAGYRTILVVQALALVVFLAISPLFPKTST